MNVCLVHTISPIIRGVHTYIEILVRVLHLYKICNQKPEIPILTPIKKYT